MSPPRKPTETAAKLDKFRHKDKEGQGEDGGPSISGAETAASETNKVLEAISTCQATLTSKIEEVKVDISLIRQDMHKLRDRVSEVEHQLTHAEDAIPPLQASSDQTARHITQLQQKQDDLENRMRRNNLRFIGLPEGTEGAYPATFLEDILIKTYGRDAFSQSFVVERAHRMPAKPPQPGAPARVFIAKFLNYRDRDAILRLSREKGNIPYRNTHIMAFPDFSAEVQRQRSRFTEVKRRLRVKHLKYAMLFPARLRVTGEDRAHFFEDPESALTWLDGLNPD